MDSEILSYIELIYRFCLHRLNSRTDAEDLSQEILLCIIESMQKQKIDNLGNYIWRVAHNRYARKIQQNQHEKNIVYGEEYLFDIEDKTSLIDNIQKTEEYSLTFKALHTLSSMYRNILVDFYVYELNIYQIAKKYDLSVETVKWRLHTGREKMKVRLDIVNKTYSKIKMHVMCNGSFDPNKYLCNQIYKAIAVACYDSPITIEEVSLATGIPTLYLEEALEYMIYGDAIEKVGNKYQTNFIIVKESDNQKMCNALQSKIKEIAEKVWTVYDNSIEEIKSIGFYGKDFPITKLAYIVLPSILRTAVSKAKEENPLPRPLRKDGGNGWFIVNEGIEKLDELYAGCNTYSYNDNIKLTYYWLGKLFDNELNVALRNAEFFVSHINNETGEFDNDNTEDTAKALRFNLVFKQNNRYYSNITIFNKEQYIASYDLTNMEHEITGLLHDWVATLYKQYKTFTPKRLHNQVNGNVQSYSFNVVAHVIKELQENGMLRTPSQDEPFVDNIFLTIF
ncbi:MAG: hypothetical protein A2Y17_00150 [Clostridiales bacterium GWF2_38_85]|nr:MAG: hypothetical protein A2Y17_00150 [Clostridiales bacterium GWF2_38_85]HBL83871.1 hypothetical protein [Clostridiales bacterium]